MQHSNTWDGTWVTKYWVKKKLNVNAIARLSLYSVISSHRDLSLTSFKKQAF